MPGGRSGMIPSLLLFINLALAVVLIGPASAPPLPIPRSGVPLETSAGPAVPLDDDSQSTTPSQTTPAHDNPLLLPASHISPADILRRSSPAIVTIMSILPTEGPVRGTGFFADARGLIVTSHHLVEGARAIKVKTRDGKIYNRIKIRAERPGADLAVLEVADLKQPEPFLRLGDSEFVRVGEPIVAIGHPLGLEYTLSTGLVSALRAAQINGLDLIQFSAPVSPGCSGGPILNSTGQVIGIICLSHPEGQNLNFAIPINYLRQLLARIDGGSSRIATLHGTDGRPSSSAPTEALSVPAGVDLVPQTPSVNVHAPVSRRVFRDGGRGFAVECPISWTCHSERSPDGMMVQMQSADGLIHIDLATVGLTPITRLDDFAGRAVRSLNSTALSADLEASESPQGPRGPRLVRETRKTVAGVDWKMFVHRFIDGDDNETYSVTMLSISKGQGYVVRYTAPVSAWNRLRGAIEQVVASTRIF